MSERSSVSGRQSAYRFHRGSESLESERCSLNLIFEFREGSDLVLFEPASVFESGRNEIQQSVVVLSLLLDIEGVFKPKQQVAKASQSRTELRRKWNLLLNKEYRVTQHK